MSRIVNLDFGADLGHVAVVTPPPAPDQAPRVYFVRELSGAQRDAFLDKNQARIQADGTLVSFKDYIADLLAMCVWFGTIHSPTPESKAAEEINGIPHYFDRLLTLDEVRGLPARMQTELNNIARELSALNFKAAETAKKN